jgi:hypothetical protein
MNGTFGGFSHSFIANAGLNVRKYSTAISLHNLTNLSTSTIIPLDASGL